MMPDSIQKNAGLVFQVTISVVLAVAVGLTCWTASKAVTLGEVVSAMKTKVDIGAEKVSTLETYGSRSLESHVQSDDVRVNDLKNRADKLEAAVILLQTMPGEVKSMNIKIDNLQTGLNRVERIFVDKTIATGNSKP